MRPSIRRSGPALAALVFMACTDRLAPPPPLSVSTDVVSAADPVIVAAGDLVCGGGAPGATTCRHAETAALVTTIAPTAALLLGDIQYESGSLSNFNAYYNPTWGVHKAITWPAPGNHEYQTSGAAGYFDYFNGVGVQTGRAGTRGQGYYSFNLGAWHIVSLNSNCGSIGGCGAGSAQEQWLRADLAANPASCTLAYWHHPRFSSGGHGNNSSMQAIWQALYDNGADLVLSGHDHDYERFGPQTATGVADATRGIRSFIVGTGGKEVAGFGSVKANSELRNSNSMGVLRLTLHATSYDWQFVPIPGHTLADAGTASCVTPAAPPPPPPPPPPAGTTLTFSPTADAHTLKSNTRKNYGTATTLLVDGSPAARTYFRFSVSGLTGKTVVSAKLRLYAVDPSDAGGRLHRVTSTSWTESGIKWSNQPSYTSAIIGTIGAVTAGSWYEVDVKSAVTANGTISFALESTSSNGADYTSREGTTAANRPQLVIVIQ
jgi:hypothetical protein